MKHILIMRHAKSDWSNNAQSDFERPLNSSGRKAAPEVGSLIKKKKLVPELILSSPAERALETTHAVRETCDLTEENVVFEEEFYTGYVPEVAKRLKTLEENINRVLVVGHNPTWTNLVTHLSGEFSEMKTAEVCILSFDGEWKNLAKASCKFVEKLRTRNAEL
ncbi:MAG: histidine phosphatase family protein [Bacteroidota bacterium]|nr:histidine phosphatase family protein [Bacteroidota bacterium]